MTASHRLHRQDSDENGAEVELDAEALDLPPAPGLRRCGSIHDVGRGQWIGTLACCSRPVGHDGDHAMSLGDVDSPTFWEETWE